jgi:hypothetical protein
MQERIPDPVKPVVVLGAMALGVVGGAVVGAFALGLLGMLFGPFLGAALGRELANRWLFGEVHDPTKR